MGDPGVEGPSEDVGGAGDQRELAGVADGVGAIDDVFVEGDGLAGVIAD